MDSNQKQYYLIRICRECCENIVGAMSQFCVVFSNWPTLLFFRQKIIKYNSFCVSISFFQLNPEKSPFQRTYAAQVYFLSLGFLICWSCLLVLFYHKTRILVFVSRVLQFGGIVRLFFKDHGFESPSRTSCCKQKEKRMYAIKI